MAMLGGAWCGRKGVAGSFAAWMGQALYGRIGVVW